MKKYLFVLILFFVPAAHGADRGRVKDIGQNLMCICGCNQLLAGCNHLNCPSSVPMEKELGAMIDQGMSKDQILAAFVTKYGERVLSAPPTKGAFNISAWAMPFAALLGGALAIIYFLRRWKAGTVPAPATTVDDSTYRDQLEEELKKYSPED